MRALLSVWDKTGIVEFAHSMIAEFLDTSQFIIDSDFEFFGSNCSSKS